MHKRLLGLLAGMALVLGAGCGDDSGGKTDGAADNDTAVPDAATPDAAVPDAAIADAGPDAFMCTPGAFFGCIDGNSAMVCNGAGTAVATQACPFACNSTMMRCEQCNPAVATTCNGAATAANHCSATGVLTTAACPLGCNAASQDCNQCVPGSDFCDANASHTVSCTSRGTPGAPSACTYGCQTQTGAGQTTAVGDCKDLVPSNGLILDCLPPGTGGFTLTLNADATIDPATGTLTLDAGGAIALPSGVYAVVTQTGGPPIGVFHFQSFAINPGVTLSVTPASTHALAILADGNVNIEGMLDVGGDHSTPGPGALQTGTGVGGTGAASGVGAGGGGHGSPGGLGGSATPSPGGAAGAVNGMLTVVPLQGGSPGGGMFAGAGGGAVQITACGLVNVSGTISAVGGGGLFGDTGRGGLGGGAGGAILLEGELVTVTGTLSSNGGGGGGGGALGVALTERGANGTLTSTPASGGAGGVSLNPGLPNGGMGGAGAAGTSSPGAGQNAPPAATGGGGGGGAGRIRLNATPLIPGGTPQTVTTGTITPQLGTGATATFSIGTTATQ